MMNKFTNMVFGAAVCIAGTLAFMGTAIADEPSETPTTLSGGKVISVVEAKKLIDAKAVTFVDTRSVVNFGKGHIPGAGPPKQARQAGGGTVARLRKPRRAVNGERA